jgi:hypothetical protein
MITISLTDFIDFISSSGTTKLTQVTAIKKREAYAFRVDYWRELRNIITNFHADGTLKKDFFDASLQSQFLDADKREKCRPLLEIYKKFLGRKQFESKEIVKCDWQYSKELTVRVNPELHLILNGNEQLVKFYFKKEPLSKKKADLALLLMKIATQDVLQNVSYTLFDLPQNKLWKTENPSEKLIPLLKGEAENFITIYKNL